MKTKEELEQIKNEYTELNKKLAELSEEELAQVTGGSHCGIYAGSALMIHSPTFVESTSDGEISPSSTSAWFGTNE